MPSKLTVAKIVANASPTAWSQAYHAGGFTAVVAISQKEDAEGMDETALHKAGKEILDTLIAEYFTLTTKDLDTVRAAVETTVAKVGDNLMLSLVVGASVKNILYIVIAGSGKALLKRGEKTGTLLELDADEGGVESVSGYLEPQDMVILETASFDSVIPQHELLEQLDHRTPEDLAEMLAPTIHGAQNGGASAIVFSYHEEEPSLLQSYVPATPQDDKPAGEFLPHDEEETPEVEEKEEKIATQHKEPEDEVQQPIPTPLPYKRSGGFALTHSQKIFLSIAVVLLVVLGASIFLFITKQQADKRQQLFQAVYAPAKVKYDEGVSLMDLNKSLAIEDLNQAKDMLSGAQSKFPTNSSEYKQVQSLLSNISQSLTSTATADTVDTSKAPDNASPLLSFMQKHLDASYVVQDDTDFYTADASGVKAYNKKTSASKQIITNNSDWKSLGGLGAYLGNVYVLDKTTGILKYVASGASFSKSNYFAAGVNPDVSKTVSLAIDGSIWLLGSDGTITKYTKGKQDSFTVSGLTSPFKSPTSIITTADFTNVYVLDKGNARVVVLSKTGAFVAEYGNGIMKNADGMDISETSKKGYILSGGTIYSFDLK